MPCLMLLLSLLRSAIMVWFSQATGSEERENSTSRPEPFKVVTPFLLGPARGETTTKNGVWGSRQPFELFVAPNVQMFCLMISGQQMDFHSAYYL